MPRLACRKLIVSSAAVAALMSLASLPTASPAAAADAGYCHARFRACAARYSNRTCDRQYDTCMANTSASAAPALIVGGFPRIRRHKDHGDPKTPPKTGGGDPKSPKGGGGTYTSQGWVVKGGSYTSGGWVTGGKGGSGGAGGGASTGGGGKPQQQQQFRSVGGSRPAFVKSSGGGHTGGGRSGGRR